MRQHEVFRHQPDVNRADELRAKIRSIACLEVDADWELVVIDNRSTDHTQAAR